MERRRESIGDEQLIERYEKEIFDLRQLLEISKSLNSTLELNQLLESILYTCMAQVHVLQAAAFIRTEVHRADLTLHRNVIGYEISPGSYLISEESELLRLLLDQFRCYTLRELEQELPAREEVKLIGSFNPSLIVPVRARGLINGVILLGERIASGAEGDVLYTDKEREFLLDVALLAGIAIHNAFLFEVTNTDLMTRLKMRHYFLTMLTSAIQESQLHGAPLSVMMLDLDHFKRVNDTYGHLFGDDVLRGVADVVLANVRQTDLAARYGGEEFIVLLPGTSSGQAIEIAERTRRGVESAAFSYREEKIVVTVSIGVAQLDLTRDLTSHMLLDRVDQALYCSKRDGRNRVTLAD
ncbi:MAG: diguanylate cyclase DgcA [Alkalispirochaetaceae bacterium]